jgi:hypothetical protein
MVVTVERCKMDANLALRDDIPSIIFATVRQIRGKTVVFE